jgi:hypothetical protein
MKPFSDLHEDELAAAMRAIRPEPAPAFAAELDQRAAAGFPRRSGGGGERSGPLAWLRRALSPKTLIPVAGVAVVAIAIVGAVLSSSGSNSLRNDVTSSEEAVSGTAGGEESAGGGEEAIESAESGRKIQAGPKAEAEPVEAESGAEVEESAGAENGLLRENGPNAAAAPHRDVERAAEITLGTKPGEVGEASAQVFQTVHAYNGIVLNSSTTDGADIGAEAHFELLIPAARLDDAMASFSKIGEVRSRHESSQDITAPTIGVAERLQDSHARVDGLLAQLAEATTEPEREAVEAELSSERNHAARLKAHLSDLKRRGNLSRVELRIESGKGAVSPGGKEGSGWGVGDAFHDAGHLLQIAAGVAIIALAVLAPLALILFLIWLAGRSWTRRARERALT